MDIYGGIYTAIGFLGVSLLVGLAKANNPNLTTKCILGLHNYYYSHEKCGMYFDNDQLVGTRRKVYMCRCGKEKSAEEGDWINR